MAEADIPIISPVESEKEKKEEEVKLPVPGPTVILDNSYNSSTVDRYQDKVNDAYRFKLPLSFFRRPAKKIAEDLMGLYFSAPNLGLLLLSKLIKSGKLTLFQQQNCQLAKIKLKKLIRHEK